MGLSLSKSKNLDSNVNGHRSGGGGGGGGGGGMHYQKTQEPPIHYNKSPAPVAAAPPQASPSPRPVLRPDTILGKVYRDIVGSPYYVAPEVLRRRYGKEIDIWSAGVILYILLSGVFPFWAETEKGIFDAILKGEIDFDSQPWPSISRSAKDLVRRMLTQDPKKRITSTQVLEHPWIREGGEASDKPIDSAVLSRMKQFRAMNKLKKLALKVIAENLSQDEIQGLKQTFTNIDTDNSGTITYEELKTGLARLGSKLTEAEVKQLMEAADVDGDGTIDYIEFITATMHPGMGVASGKP